MSFRENLRNELNFQDLQTKELAQKTGINKRTLDGYLAKNGNEPTVGNAVKIAQVLGVSVEYLTTGKDSDFSGENSSQEMILFHKYRNFVKKIESLPEDTNNCLSFLVDKLIK
ncbi:MAG: helix-turn-helix transcriptional regulator [Treponema sp.]|nr:helix-turn-helix transcriptional regulator [Treponema sp.]